MNYPDRTDKLIFRVSHVLLVKKVGDRFEGLGNFTTLTAHLRLMTGWELKDCVDMPVPFMHLRFVYVQEIISKPPYYMFIISP